MIGAVLVGLVAAIHLAILLMEMVLWETPQVRRIFGVSPEFAANTRVMAANQGLYNGFLAAGLIWGLCLGHEGRHVDIFFLSCVIVAVAIVGVAALLIAIPRWAARRPRVRQ